MSISRIHHRLPYALVASERMHVFEKAAKDAAANGMKIVECIKLKKMDSYLNQPRLEVQDRWDFTRYKAMEKPNKSYNKRQNPAPEKLDRRLLLFAETQIGKTGAFIQFLLNVVQALASISNNELP